VTTVPDVSITKVDSAVNVTAVSLVTVPHVPMLTNVKMAVIPVMITPNVKTMKVLSAASADPASPVSKTSKVMVIHVRTSMNVNQVNTTVTKKPHAQTPWVVSTAHVQLVSRVLE
jgi:hypothetical protein